MSDLHNLYHRWVCSIANGSHRISVRGMGFSRVRNSCPSPRSITSLSASMFAHLWFVHNLKVFLRVGERTFSCDCSKEFGLEFDESCTTKWTYFCNPNFIAHYGYKVTLNSNWVQSFNKSIATDIYGHSVAEYPELPLGKANILITLIFFIFSNNI